MPTRKLFQTKGLGSSRVVVQLRLLSVFATSLIGGYELRQQRSGSSSCSGDGLHARGRIDGHWAVLKSLTFIRLAVLNILNPLPCASETAGDLLLTQTAVAK